MPATSDVLLASVFKYTIFFYHLGISAHWDSAEWLGGGRVDEFIDRAGKPRLTVRFSLLFCSPVVQGVLPAVEHGRGGAAAPGEDCQTFLFMFGCFFLFVFVDDQKPKPKRDGTPFLSLSLSLCLSNWGSCGQKGEARRAKSAKSAALKPRISSGPLCLSERPPCRNTTRAKWPRVSAIESPSSS